MIQTHVTIQININLTENIKLNLFKIYYNSIE